MQALHKNADSLKTTRKSKRVIYILQQKTKTEVTIPILSHNLIVICKKYGYNIPQICAQVLT